LYNLLQYLIDTCPGLGGNQYRIGCIQPYYILNLLFYTVRIGAGKIYFIYHRDYLQVILNCHVYIGQCLGLYALGGIHHQQSPLTGRQAAGNLV